MERRKRALGEQRSGIDPKNKNLLLSKTRETKLSGDAQKGILIIARGDAAKIAQGANHARTVGRHLKVREWGGGRVTKSLTIYLNILARGKRGLNNRGKEHVKVTSPSEL